MKREIKFRFFTPDKRMIDEHNGWVEGIGINEALKYSKEYGYEIMQYTGMKDCNGTEIYEGDILIGISNNPFSFGDENYYEVMWGVDSWHIKDTMFSIQELRNYCNNQIEVIGNIFESPELIK